MNLLDYTTYEEVRAALGVTPEELEDATLGLGMYAVALELELEEIAVGIPASYAGILALDTRTVVQDRFLQVASLFATYSVARHLGAALPMFGPKEVSDGKATVGRFASNPYKDTLKSVDRMYGVARDKLGAAYGALGSASRGTVARVFMSVVSPASDPVTGT